MSRKGKSRNVIARHNLLRGNAKLAARKARAKGYDRTRYDGTDTDREEI
jgi:hypothetical protein